MKWRVTKPITIQGRYYAAGEVVEASPQIDSYRRMLHWVAVDDDTPTTKLQSEAPAGDLSGLRKAELVALAEERGLPVPAKSTRKDLIALLG